MEVNGNKTGYKHYLKCIFQCSTELKYIHTGLEQHEGAFMMSIFISG